MKPRLKLTFDSAALGALALLAALLAVAIFFGRQAGTRVTSNLPADGLISPLHVLRLNFSAPVNQQLVETLFSVEPKVEGQFSWVDETVLQFVPAQAYQRGVEYRFTLRADESSAAILKRAWKGSARARDPLVVFLGSEKGQSRIWALDPETGIKQALTPTDLKAMEFDAAKDGNFIVFTVANEKGGIDLWQVDRDGGDARMMLACGYDRCLIPAIAPDSSRVAYVREAAAVSADLPFGAPRVWLLDLQNAQTAPLYEDPQILGYAPAWSPDSQTLVTYGGLEDQIRLLDLPSGKQFIFQSNTGARVAWSGDSAKMSFTNTEEREGALLTFVRVADVRLNQTTNLFGEGDTFDRAYASIAWSPATNEFVLGMRTSVEDPAQRLFLIDYESSGGIVFADEEGYTYNSPYWDPWGTAVVFQQFKMRGQFKSEIGLWRPGLDAPLILAEGFSPQWLP